MTSIFSTSKLFGTTDPKRITQAVVLLGIIIRIPLIPASLTYFGDIWRQTDTASIAHHFWINGFKILYPQIYWSGNGPGYVETEFQLYPFLTSLLYALFGEHVWLGRLLSFLFSAMTIIFFYLLANQVLKPWEALWAQILFVFSPLLLRYAAAFMPEATVLCFYVASLYFFIRWLNKQEYRWLILTTLTTSLAILVKPTAINIGLVFLLLAIDHFGWKILKERKVWLASFLCLLPVILYYWHAHNVYLQYGNTFGILSGGDSKFGNLYFWTNPQFYLGVIRIELKWVFTPLAILFFLVGLVLSWKRRQFLLIFSTLTIGIYFFILARFSGYERGFQYHIYMVPFAALGFGMGVNYLFSATSKSIVRGLVLISVLTVIGWSATLYPDMLRPPEPGNLLVCAQQVQELVPANQRIIVSTFDYSTDIEVPTIPNNFQEPSLFFYSQRYGWSLPADWLYPEKLESLREEGASFYVLLDRDQNQLLSNQRVQDFLQANAKQVGPGIQKGCDIYQFNP